MSGAAGARLPAIDWSAPWLQAWRTVGERVAARTAAGASVAEALDEELSARPVPLAVGGLAFVPQAELPAGVAYEAHIARTARVPTRDNLHDFFNGLAWLHHPRLKRALNERQAQALQRDGVRSVRGPLRDALTLFDENAAWVQWPDSLAEAWRQQDWQTLFVQRRADWAEARITLFGHALIEKLTAPRKAITAHAWAVPRGLAPAEAEDWLCKHLDQRLPQRHPLVVLGVPGWWPANEAPGFYDDTSVFRPRRGAPVPAGPGPEPGNGRQGS
jgi:Protein of unknown function (DUF3025)